MSRSLQTALVMFFVFYVIGFGLYSAGLSAPFFFDSTDFVDQSYKFSTYDFGDVVKMFKARRPIPAMTVYLNYLVSDVDPYYYRLFNVVVLAATAVLVFLFIRLILSLPQLVPTIDDRRKTVLAVVLALLFLVHPLQVFVVMFVWQRIALLANFFFFACLLCYVATRGGNIKHLALGYAMSFVFFVCAVLSKENTIAAIPVIVLIEIAFFSGAGNRIWKRLGWSLAAILLLSVLLLTVLSLYGRAWTPQRHLDIIGGYYSQSGLTFPEAILTQCRAWFSYLSMIVAPIPSGLPMIRAEIISRSLLDPPTTLVALAGVSALVAGGIALLRKRPLSSFGILFFVITLIPESILVPHFQFCAYRAVLPMAGLLLVLADIVLWASNRPRTEEGKSKARLATVCVFGAAVVLCGLGTHVKAMQWNNPVGLWTEFLLASPRKFGPAVEKRIYRDIINNLGEALWRRRDFKTAAQWFRLGIELNPRSGTAHFNLANVLEELGQTKQAATHYRKAIRLNPRHSGAHVNLGELMRKKGNLSEAIRHFRLAIKINPHLPEGHHNYGIALMQKGQLAEAVRSFMRSVRIDPRSPESRYDLGLALAMSGNLPHAITHFSKAVELKPDFAKAHHNLAVALLQSGRRAEAARHLKIAIQLDPNLSKTQQLLSPDASTPVK